MSNYEYIPTKKELEFEEGKIQIKDYNIDLLCKYLSSFSKTDLPEVKEKNHIAFFDVYFKKLKVKTMLIEYPYIDKDYLEDYSAYYARSFSSYDKTTIRIHFFNDQAVVTSTTVLEKLMKGNDTSEDFNKAYVGYMVVKPIPKTMIGKTVIKTYPENNNEGRIYPIKRRYYSHLYGLEFILETIGYQEQDRSVAACATSALWSIFQSTAILFQHIIPSPAEITRLATEHSYVADRSFPTRGLTMEQISNCVKTVGLQPQCHDINDYNVLKAFIKAYLNAQIPILLGISLFSKKQNRFIGEHAVAVNGFSSGLQESSNYYGRGNSKYRLHLNSSRIDKIYVHDDQVGPFARMEFDDDFFSKVIVSEHSKKVHYASTSTAWRLNKEDEIRAIPNTIMVPLYHKIRISFEDIFKIVSGVNVYVNHIFINPEGEHTLKSNLIDEWDILLEGNSQFKRSLLKKEKIPNSISQKNIEAILLKSLPKFFWRVLAYKEGKRKLEILFDSTDIAEGSLFLDIICYDDDYCAFLYQVLKKKVRYDIITIRQIRHTLGKMIEKLESLYKDY